MRSTTNLVICSSLLLCSCASVQRPNAYAWGVNGKAEQIEGYNVKTDYDDNGVRLPDAKKVIHPLPNGLRDLNGAICFLPPRDGDDGIKGMKVWLSDSRKWAQQHCK